MGIPFHLENDCSHHADKLYAEHIELAHEGNHVPFVPFLELVAM